MTIVKANKGLLLTESKSKKNKLVKVEDRFSIEMNKGNIVLTNLENGDIFAMSEQKYSNSNFEVVNNTTDETPKQKNLFSNDDIVTKKTQNKLKEKLNLEVEVTKSNRRIKYTAQELIAERNKQFESKIDELVGTAIGQINKQLESFITELDTVAITVKFEESKDSIATTAISRVIKQLEEAGFKVKKTKEGIEIQLNEMAK